MRHFIETETTHVTETKCVYPSKFAANFNAGKSSLNLLDTLADVDVKKFAKQNLHSIDLGMCADDPSIENDNVDLPASALSFEDMSKLHTMTTSTYDAARDVSKFQNGAFFKSCAS